MDYNVLLPLLNLRDSPFGIQCRCINGVIFVALLCCNGAFLASYAARYTGVVPQCVVAFAMILFVIKSFQVGWRFTCQKCCKKIAYQVWLNKQKEEEGLEEDVVKPVDNTAQKTEALADNILVNVLTKIGKTRRSETALKSHRKHSKLNLNKPLIAGAGSRHPNRMPKVLGHKEIDDETACDHDEYFNNLKPPNLIVLPDEKRTPSSVSVPKMKRRVSSTISDFLNTSRQLRRQKIGNNHDYIVMDEAGPRLDDFDFKRIPMGRVLAAEDNNKDDPFKKANELLASNDSRPSQKVDENNDSEAVLKNPSPTLLKCCGLVTEGENDPPFLAGEDVAEKPVVESETRTESVGKKTTESQTDADLEKEPANLVANNPGRASAITQNPGNGCFCSCGPFKKLNPSLATALPGKKNVEQDGDGIIQPDYEVEVIEEKASTKSEGKSEQKQDRKSEQSAGQKTEEETEQKSEQKSEQQTEQKSEQKSEQKVKRKMNKKEDQKEAQKEEPKEDQKEEPKEDQKDVQEETKKEEEKADDTEDECVADPVISIEEVNEKSCSADLDKDPPSPLNMMVVEKAKSSVRSVSASTQTDDNLVTTNQQGTATTQVACTNDLLWSNHATCGSKRSTMTTFKYLDVDKPLTGIELMVLSDKQNGEMNVDKKKLESVPFESNIVSESEMGKKLSRHKGKKSSKHKKRRTSQSFKSVETQTPGGSLHSKDKKFGSLPFVPQQLFVNHGTASISYDSVPPVVEGGDAGGEIYPAVLLEGTTSGSHAGTSFDYSATAGSTATLASTGMGSTSKKVYFTCFATLVVAISSCLAFKNSNVVWVNKLAVQLENPFLFLAMLFTSILPHFKPSQKLKKRSVIFLIAANSICFGLCFVDESRCPFKVLQKMKLVLDFLHLVKSQLWTVNRQYASAIMYLIPSKARSAIPDPVLETCLRASMFLVLPLLMKMSASKLKKQSSKSLSSPARNPDRSVAKPKKKTISSTNNSATALPELLIPDKIESINVDPKNLLGDSGVELRPDFAKIADTNIVAPAFMAIGDLEDALSLPSPKKQQLSTKSSCKISGTQESVVKSNSATKKKKTGSGKSRKEKFRIGLQYEMNLDSSVD